MKRFLSVVITMLAALFLFDQPTMETPVSSTETYTDSRGTVYAIKPVSRIVSLGPTVTEGICALGAEDKLVGRTDFCNWPESVSAIPSIGGIINPSVEKIIRLQPDLVIASSMVGDDVYQAIQNAGIPAISINKEGSFDGVFSFIHDLGLVIGKEKEAAALEATMRSQLEEIQTTYQNAPKKRVYIAVAFGPYDATATGDTYMDEMITLAGGINVAKDGKNWMFTKEQLVLAKPDVVILMGQMNDGSDGQEILSQWKATKPYGDLPAKVNVIDGDLIGRQGPRLVQAVAELARLIHED